jgi:hypothetical protein
MKTCLRRLSCNLCFILIATFSKTKIANATPLSVIKMPTTLTKVSESTKADSKLLDIATNKIDVKLLSDKKEVLSPLPKKKKKINKPETFEIKVLPNGEYTPQENNDGNIRITKKIMIFK